MAESQPSPSAAISIQANSSDRSLKKPGAQDNEASGPAIGSVWDVVSCFSCIFSGSPNGRNNGNLQMDKCQRERALAITRNKVVSSAVSNILQALLDVAPSSSAARLFLHWENAQSSSGTLYALLKTPDRVSFDRCQRMVVIPVEFNAIMISNTLFEGTDEVGRDLEYLIPFLTDDVQNKISNCLLSHKYICSFEPSNERGHKVPSVVISW